MSKQPTRPTKPSRPTPPTRPNPPSRPSRIDEGEQRGLPRIPNPKK